MDLKLKLFPDGLSTGMLIFDLTANNGSVVNPLTATREEMLAGKNVTVNDNVTEVYLTPQGACAANKLTMIVPVVAGTLATVVMTALDQATLTSIRASGEVTVAGSSTVSDHGFVYSKNHMPTVDDLVNCTKVSVGSGTGTFLKIIPNLTSNTVYYIRAYAKNDKGTAHSPTEIALSTLASGVGEQDPTITLNPITNIDAPTAKATGLLTNPSYLTVLELGVCWGTVENPIYTGSKNVATIITGTAGGVYESTLNPLVTNADYFVRAFVRYRNTAGVEKVVYSINVPPIQFKAVDVPVITLATVSIDPVVVDGATSASSGGTVLTDGGGTYLKRGLCWSTVPMPQMPAAIHSDNGTTLGHFVTQMTGLTTGVTHYVRAYVQNDAGYNYSDVQMEFKPAAIVVAVKPSIIFTQLPVAISPTSAQLFASITNDGGSKITQRGFMYIKDTDQVGGNTFPDHTNPAFNPTLVTYTEANPIGPFNKILTGLETAVQYNFYAFAVNAAGLFEYSIRAVIILSTASGKPQVGLQSISTADTTSDIIVSIGGVSLSSIIAGYKVMWGLTEATMVNTVLGEPLYEYVSNGITTVRFKALITGLTPNRSYVIKAFASNAIGEGTSAATTITTSPIATTPITITMVEAQIINRTDARLVGNISPGNNIMVKGFCWAIGTVPIKGVGNFIERTTNTDGGVYFEDVIGLLSPGKTYNFKAYAQNSLSGGALVYSANTIVGTTNTISPPTISQMARPTFIAYDSAKESAQVTNDGGSAIIECGFMWSYSGTPTLQSILGKLYPMADFVFPITTMPLTDGFGNFNNIATGLWLDPEDGIANPVGFTVVPYAINAAGGAMGHEILAQAETGPTMFLNDPVIVLSPRRIDCIGSFNSVSSFDVVTATGFRMSINADMSGSTLYPSLEGAVKGSFSKQITIPEGPGTYYVTAAVTWTGPYSASKESNSFVRVVVFE